MADLPLGQGVVAGRVLGTVARVGCGRPAGSAPVPGARATGCWARWNHALCRVVVGRQREPAAPASGSSRERPEQPTGMSMFDGSNSCVQLASTDGAGVIAHPARGSCPSSMVSMPAT